MNNYSLAVRSIVVAGVALLWPIAASAQAVLGVSPTSITAQATDGVAAPSQTVTIDNIGNRRLRWSISAPTASWLIVSPTSGAQRSTVTVSFSAKPAGSYSASFTVTGGSSTPVTVNVVLNVSSSSGSSGGSGGSVTSPPPPPPSTSGVGPQSTIACPSGSVSIYPGTGIQGVVDTYGGNTAFCLRAGTHSIRSSITPKTGDSFVGEYGAILDGTGWSTSDSTQAAFRAHNQDIDYVTIRNLVIRNMPQRGIHAFYYMSDHWTIDYNEIASTQWGIVFPSDSTIKNNYIHHNTSGGYLGTYSHNSILENNQIAYNGKEQKVGESANVTFRNNFVHHNAGDGIWFDSNNSAALIEGNTVEDNGFGGIFYEIGTGATIRYNTIRRSGDTAVFISTSKNSQIYGNTLDGNFRGITYFVNCASVGGGTIGFDLSNNSAHDNTITLGSQSGALASALSYTGCTSTQAATYMSSKGLSFSTNTYDVPAPTTGQYWLWNGMKYWNEWQALGLDTGGIVK